MKEIGTVAILVYLIAATLGEVYLSGTMSVGLTYYAILGAIAISETVVVGTYYMRLKWESFAVRMVAMAGMFFIAVLIISLLFVYA